MLSTTKEEGSEEENKKELTYKMLRMSIYIENAAIKMINNKKNNKKKQKK